MGDEHVSRRDVITEEVDMELDSDEDEIDEKLDRAYENSKSQERSVNLDRNEESNALLRAAAAHTAPQMDTLSLLKAIADTGALISPALQTQLEFIQQGNHSILPQSNSTSATDVDKPKVSIENRLNKLKNVALASLQPINEPYSHIINPHEPLFTKPYAPDSLISPPSAYLSQEQIPEHRPPSGQSTPLLDEAPDSEEHKQTPNQYNQFASYTQGLYKPIESAPSDELSKEMHFGREFFIPNETKKIRIEAPPISLNLKVIDYKHGTSVRPAVSAPLPLPLPPPPFNDPSMPRMPQSVPLEVPHPMPQHHTRFATPLHQQQQQSQQLQQNQLSPQQQQQQQQQRPQQQLLNTPYRPQANIPLLPHLLPQSSPPFNIPNNQMPPYRMQDMNRQDPNINHSASSPQKDQMHEDRKRFHEQPAHFQAPPPHPPLFRPPPNLMPPGNRPPPPPFDFRMPPPNDPSHRYQRPPHPHFLRHRHNFQHDYHRSNH